LGTARTSASRHTLQSDVETVHRLVEDEFFDLESFASRGDFLAKAFTYQLYFNLVRPNSQDFGVFSQANSVTSKDRGVPRYYLVNTQVRRIHGSARCARLVPS